MVLVATVALLATATFLVLRENADGASVLEDAPTLQGLAELSETTPGDDETAPDFSVKTFDGPAFTLSRHLAEDGRPVILNLWASWCLPCRAEMPALDAFAAEHPGITVVGVAVQDDLAAAERFAEEIGVGYLLGFDDKEQVDGAYRAIGLPATFWISSEGVIVKRMFGGVTEESLAEAVSVLDEGA